MSQQSTDRAKVVASMLIAMLEAKQIFPRGETTAERAADIGEAFKALYQTVSQTERAD